MTKPMLKQMCVEFLRYRWFPLLGAVVGLQLSVAYLTMHNPGVPPVGMLRLCLFATGFAGNYLGYYIQRYLAKPHTALVPGFRNAHIRFALSLNCIFAMLETGVMIAGPWQNVSNLAAFAIVWVFGSVWLGIAWICRTSKYAGRIPDLFWLFGLTLWPGRVMAALLGFFSNATPAKTASLLAAGLTLNVVLATKVLTAGKDYRSADWWASMGPIVRKLFWNRTLRALDAIPHPVSGDFFSQVRLFRLSRQLLPHALLIAMFLGGLCLAQYQVGKEQLEIADSTLLWMIYAALIPLVQSGMLGGSKVNFRLVLRLPLRRQDAVARYGASSLVLAMKVWISFVAAAFISALLPFGFGLKAFPSLRFLVTSFSVHLAVFAIMAFISSLQIRTAGEVIVAIQLFGALGVTALLVPVSFFPLASILIAMGLLWASYSLFCNAEMD